MRINWFGNLGNAAYTARILLGIDPVFNEEVAYRFGQSSNDDKNPAILLYPNPAQDKIQLDVLNGMELENATFTVYTALGEQVYSQHFSTKYYMQQFEVENLKNGIYLYKISTADGYIYSGKLSILK